ncbi:MAG TPA: primosomal protein N' [Terriglobia bacterium]|nr:primosomal protein N' [Terriglobia bacterium]
MPAYCEVALPVPVDHPFTYSIPAGVEVCAGSRVVVPFGARKLVGVVLRLNASAQGLDPAAIKPIQRTLDEAPALSAESLRLSRWIADYYLAPQGEVLATMLPLNAAVSQRTRVVLTDAGQQALEADGPSAAAEQPSAQEREVLRRIARRGGLRRQTLRNAAPVVSRLRRKGWVAVEMAMEPRTNRAAPDEPPAGATGCEAAVRELTREQAAAYERIRQQMATGRFGVLLLHGVTGSGKTEVYLRAMETALQQGRPALLLVPEINLTPAMTRLFTARWGTRVAVLHSGLEPKERIAQWLRIRHGGAAVVIGTRSAVFAPLERPGLVIVDEEHDSSYKQEETPRYHGRDVAIVRAQQCNATVVLGSATPAIETRHHAESGKYQLLEIESRVAERPLAAAEIVDMREEFAATGRQTFLSRRLLEAIAARLARREQIMILLNRRGYSAFVLCRSCGKTIECAHCSIALTHHRRPGRLLCHYCGFARPVPRVCPQCSSEHLYFLGEGSERVEETLARHFPEARIGRLDRDTARGRGRAEAILAAFRQHELDILVGTQMIAKGHDIHRVTLVGVISADVGLALPDFRAAERSFQLLTQAAGRAGRGEQAGEVIIQTYYPDHYAIRAAAAQNYEQFYRQELRFREVMHYPPFAALAHVLVKSSRAETALQWTAKLGRFLETQQGHGLRILGPAAAPIARLKKSYRYHFLIKAEKRSRLRTTLLGCREFAVKEKVPAAALVIDVDPQSFL